MAKDVLVYGDFAMIRLFYLVHDLIVSAHTGKHRLSIGVFVRQVERLNVCRKRATKRGLSWEVF